MVVRRKPLTKDHLPRKTAFSGPKGWSLVTGFYCSVVLSPFQALGLYFSTNHDPGLIFFNQSRPWAYIFQPITTLGLYFSTNHDPGLIFFNQSRPWAYTGDWASNRDCVYNFSTIWYKYFFLYFEAPVAQHFPPGTANAVLHFLVHFLCAFFISGIVITCVFVTLWTSAMHGHDPHSSPI